MPVKSTSKLDKGAASDDNVLTGSVVTDMSEKLAAAKAAGADDAAARVVTIREAIGHAADSTEALFTLLKEAADSEDHLHLPGPDGNGYADFSAYVVGEFAEDLPKLKGTAMLAPTLVMLTERLGLNNSQAAAIGVSKGRVTQILQAIEGNAPERAPKPALCAVPKWEKGAKRPEGAPRGASPTCKAAPGHKGDHVFDATEVVSPPVTAPSPPATAAPEPAPSTKPLPWTKAFAAIKEASALVIERIRDEGNLAQAKAYEKALGVQYRAAIAAREDLESEGSPNASG